VWAGFGGCWGCKRKIGCSDLVVIQVECIHDKDVLLNDELILAELLDEGELQFAFTALRLAIGQCPH
jgi:hypothetical protein